MMKVVVPVKDHSGRCPNKNFRPFHGSKSLLEVKIGQLLQVFDASDIYIASASDSTAPIAQRLSVRHLPLTACTTQDEFGWSRLMREVARSIPGDDDLAWVCATAPLFDEFERVAATWEQHRHNHDSLVVATAATHYFIASDGMPVNFQYGPWHHWSQRLAEWFRVDWACCVAPRSTIERCAYFIGTRPFLLKSNGFQVDIDTEEEFRAAQILFREAH